MTHVSDICATSDTVNVNHFFLREFHDISMIQIHSGETKQKLFQFLHALPSGLAIPFRHLTHNYIGL